MKNNMRKQFNLFKDGKTDAVDIIEKIGSAAKAISDLEESGQLKISEELFNDSTKNIILDILKAMPIFDTLPKPDNAREEWAQTLSEQIIKNREENSLKITVPQP